MIWADYNISLENLQLMLCEALYGDTTDEHLAIVVPRQGNLLNPQQMMQCSAYFTFFISEAHKIMPNRAFGTDLVASVDCKVELQAIGLHADKYMLTTLFWDERADIHKLFGKYHTQLRQTDRRIVSTPYFQDGANSCLSYNTTLNVISAVTLVDDSAQGRLAVLPNGTVYPPNKE